MIKRIVLSSLSCAVIFSMLMACGDSMNESLKKSKVVAVAKGTFTDSRDGQIYKTVTIGEQTWMAENMNYEMPGSYCYGDKALNCVKYGRLYSLKSAKEACPADWRLPTALDWSVLIFSIGGESVAGKYLKSAEGWIGGGNGTDDYGFAALPAGAKYGESNYGTEGKSAFFWNDGGTMYLQYYSGKANIESVGDDRWLSVRCVKAETPNSSSSAELNSSAESVSSSSNATIPAARGFRMEGDFLVDLRDNQVYKTVKIGTQTWMAENLNYSVEKSSCNLVICTESGRYYTWDAAVNACPDGWHLPTRAEWKTLISFAGGNSVAGKMLRGKASGFGGERMRGPGIEFYRVDGTDELGFLALEPDYWSSTEDDKYNAYHIDMPSKDGSANLKRNAKSESMHVRCLLGEAERVEKKKHDKIVVDSSKTQIHVDSVLSANISANQGTFTDKRDGKMYKTIKIGAQTWMAENMNYETELSFCFAHDSSNCPKYGRLYGRAAAKNVCPVGWHLPSLQEWDELFVTVGGQFIADLVLKSKTDWKDEEKGSDLYGFSVLPAGYKSSWKNREFKKLGEAADFWTSTECDSKENCLRTVSMLEGKTDRTSGLDSSASSIRCLKDETRETSPLTNQDVKEKSNVVPDSALLIDSRDGQTYRTVKIGSQTWMAENLRYKTKESFCYNDNPNNCTQYGRLYEWYDAKGACPVGWHLPSLEDWEDLFVAVGNRSVAGTALKSRTGWRDSIVGTDDYGFSALPAGTGSKNNKYYSGGYDTYWWSTAECRYYAGCKQAISLKLDDVDWRHGGSESRYSVRCLKDDAPKVLSKVGVVKADPLKDARDGHTYKTVKIGSQTWMAENLNYETKNSSCHGDSVANCKKYGRFYTWYESIQCEDKWIDEDGDGWGHTQRCNPKPPVQGVCPDGWHLPSLREWTTLISEVGGEKIAGTVLKSKKGWAGEKNGSDGYGFAALPVVYDKSYEGSFTEKNDKAEFWSSTKFEGEHEAYYMGLTNEDVYHFDRVGHGLHLAMRGEYANLLESNKQYKKSVRCVKDGLDLSNAKDQRRKTKDESVQHNVSDKRIVATSAVPPNRVEGVVEGIFTDSRDGHVYKTVTIGQQTWMAQNLNYNVEKSICRGDSTGVCAKNGRLYSWNLAKEACPTGWRLPMLVDWDTLFAVVGGQSVAGKSLKSSMAWYGHGNGSDAYGFSAYPINVFGQDDRYFIRDWNSKMGRSAFFWSFDNDKEKANIMYLLYYSDKAFFDTLSKDYGFPVRCIKGDLPDGSKKKMVEGSPLTDARDGRTYKTVKIGKQVWMAENLNFATPNSYCSKDSTKKDSASYCDKYGRYYKWSDAMDSAGVYSQDAKGCGAEKNCIPNYPVQGICPTGWHLPSLIEWNVLFASVGGMDSAGKALKTVTGWNGTAIGTDDYGFSAIPGGGYWSSTEDGYRLAYSVGVYGDSDEAYRSTSGKQGERNRVRCVKNENLDDNHLKQANVAASGSKLDSSLLVDTRDGQIYKTVIIGKQTWMAENLNYETEYSECSDDNVIMCSKFGRLYPWSLAMDSAAVYSENGKGCGYRKACFPTEPVRGICPDGWHLPTSKEWGTLLETIGGPSFAHVALKTVTGWKNGSNGMDKFGFSALPMSLRHEPYKYSYDRKDNAAFFWSSSKYDADEALAFVLHDRQKDKPIEEITKNSSLSIRCVKNDPPQAPTETSDFLSGKSSAWGVMKDPRDGQTYKTVTFGKYTWMAENIKYETEHSNCYDDDPANCAHNGRLYEWQALKTVCPAGWHLPTEAEWDTLFLAVGGASVAGKKLKSKKGWLDCESKIGLDKDGNGSDEFGFTVRPVGVFRGFGSVTEKEGYKTCFHTTEKDDKSMEVEMCFDYCKDSVVRTDSYTYYALNVRCIKDYSQKDGGKKIEKKSSSIIPPSSVVKGSLVDSRDGQTYKTVKIGSQTWLAQNLNFKTEKSLCLDNDSTNCAEFGSIYTWADAMKACPAGWHLPTEKDWKTLINAVGDSTTAANALKSSEGWVGYKDINGGGPDEYGFSVQPVGCWNPPDEMFPKGSFSINGFSTDFWTSKELDDDNALIVGMGYFYGDISMGEDLKVNGNSVRCVMD